MTHATINRLKILCLILYTALGSNAYYDRMYDLGFTLKGALFFVLLSCCLLGVVFTAYIRNNAVRLTYASILFISSVVYLAYENITSDFLSYNAFITLINARGFAGEAVIQFKQQILFSLLVSSLVFIAIATKPKIKHYRIHILATIAPVSVIALLSTILFIRGGDGGKGLQSPFIPLAYAGLAIYEASNSSHGERKSVQIDRPDITPRHDIVLIIDESISPKYLDINSETGIQTNLKNRDKNITVLNYGYAASITNCSHASNLTLRYGGSRENYLATISSMPSIWQYAKKANFNTVYIDAQRTGMRLQNGMTQEEANFIDRFIQFDNVPIVSRDIEAAAELVELINNNTSDFIIINKIGAHFPVHDKYPDNYMRYKPVLSRGGFEDISDTGSRDGFSGGQNEWLLYRNSYRNTLLWNVGHFFEIILENANMNNAVILYTSDHGQDLHENGETGTNTHCSSEPAMEEGLVPLVILQGKQLETEKWQLHLNKNINNSSHYNIFPTLLSLMEYDPIELKNTYGNSLALLTNDNLTFNTLFYARLGQKAKWKRIIIDNISTTSDTHHKQQ